MDALHGSRAGTSHVTHLGYGPGFALHFVIVLLGLSATILGPEELQLGLVDDVVETVEVGAADLVLDVLLLVLVMADGVGGVASGQVKESARHQDRLLHLVHRLHERLHALQDTRVAELGLLMAQMPSSTENGIWLVIFCLLPKV